MHTALPIKASSASRGKKPFARPVVSFKPSKATVESAKKVATRAGTWAAWIVPLIILVILLEFEEAPIASFEWPAMLTLWSAPAPAPPDRYTGPRLTMVSSPHAPSVETAPRISEPEAAAPVHVVTCVYWKDWEDVLPPMDPSEEDEQDRSRKEAYPSVSLYDNIKALKYPMSSVTVLFANGMEKASVRSKAAARLRAICSKLQSEGFVAGSCLRADTRDLLPQALAYMDFDEGSFGGESNLGKSVCPAIAVYLSVYGFDRILPHASGQVSQPAGRMASDSSGSSKGKGKGKGKGHTPTPEEEMEYKPIAGEKNDDSSLLVFWEGDVTIIEGSTWVEVAARYAWEHKAWDAISNPCHNVREICLPGTTHELIQGEPKMPVLWRRGMDISFSQQIFAASSRTLSGIPWRETTTMSDQEVCGGMPVWLGFEQRMCRWMKSVPTAWRYMCAGSRYAHIGRPARMRKAEDNEG
jgi:hypothetical protein